MFPFIAVILVNILGYTLKYFGLDRYIIIAGFRFHLSLILPFITLLFSKDYRQRFKDILLNPDGRKYLFSALFVLLPLVILFAVLFALNAVDLSDPDYFYELGLTSILDYPVYLFWNFPQILMFALFLLVSVQAKKFRFLLTLLLMFSLFIYEFIPATKGAFPVFDLAAFILAAVLFSAFLSVVRNVYLFCAVIFTVVWSNLLLFGSSSKVMINLLLARTYDSWEGFFIVSKPYTDFMTIAQLTVTLILFFIPFILSSRRVKQVPVTEYKIENVVK